MMSMQKILEAKYWVKYDSRHIDDISTEINHKVLDKYRNTCSNLNQAFIATDFTIQSLEHSFYAHSEYQSFISERFKN